MSNYFNTNLKFIREKKGLSQNKLANIVGVNQTTIARWETQEIIPSIDNVEDVSKALNISLPDMLAIDLRIEHPNEEIREVEFGNMKVTLSKDGKITDKDILEMNQFLMEEKIKNNENKD